MNLTKAIDIQEKEIADLGDEINALMKLGEWNKAIEKQQRKELLERQINLAKVL